MTLIIIYITGFVVCLIYDATLVFAGYEPYGDLKKYQIVLDIMFWPITVIMALGLSIYLKSKKSKPNEDRD